MKQKYDLEVTFQMSRDFYTKYQSNHQSINLANNEKLLDNKLFLSCFSSHMKTTNKLVGRIPNNLL